MSRAVCVRSKRRPNGSMPSLRRVSIFSRRTFNSSFCSSSLVMADTPSGSTGTIWHSNGSFPLLSFMDQTGRAPNRKNIFTGDLGLQLAKKKKPGRAGARSPPGLPRPFGLLPLHLFHKFPQDTGHTFPGGLLVDAVLHPGGTPHSLQVPGGGLAHLPDGHCLPAQGDEAVHVQQRELHLLSGCGLGQE